MKYSANLVGADSQSAFFFFTSRNTRNQIIFLNRFHQVAKMYINLQPGQESLLTFKLRLDKGTFDNVTSNKWDNLLKKDVHWKDILRHDIYVNNRNPTKNPNTDKLLDENRCKSIVGKFMLIASFYANSLFSQFFDELH